MHTQTTKNQFLRLRVQGLSLASIGRQLGVSKPTLIKWKRQSRAEIDLRIATDQQQVQEEVAASSAEQLADLRRKHHALKQELFSRALRDIPTAHLEALAGELRQRIETLDHESQTVSLSASVGDHVPRSGFKYSGIQTVAELGTHWDQGRGVAPGSLTPVSAPSLEIHEGTEPNRT